ncbi:MAG: 3-phosphoshikimate 1-carboxyvinyltransferase, partial [Bacteroidales bacterium]|nr:3-phosphoshikimate 1-carboxyvinyltransferase [Bacteroidales bacterium]
ELELTGETFSSSYISMTLDLMKQAGAIVNQEGKKITVRENPYEEKLINAEPDWSSASYWFMVAGLHPDAEIMLKGLSQNSSQGDSLIAGIFDNLGIQSEFNAEGLKIRRSGICLPEFRFDFRNNPDMVQSFVPYCIAKGIPFYFSGCKTLRIKETDRVFALYQELGKFGVEISYSEDGDLIWWDGLTKPDWQRKVSVSTYKDHRMALGMAPLSIKTGELVIEDPMVVTKSYPSFWRDFEDAGFILSR